MPQMVPNDVEIDGMRQGWPCDQISTHNMTKVIEQVGTSQAAHGLLYIGRDTQGMAR
jgi:hypothetical protein